MSQIQSQLENVPGYGMAMDYFNDYAEEHWNKTDPYQDEQGNKLKLPQGITSKQEQKAWKRIQAQAWKDDKCLLGSCGVGMDCGVGLATFMTFFFPVLGPLVMYAIHSRLITIAQENFNLPNKLQAKLHSNITFDLIITFPPLIGSFFGWLHGCSTRNAGMIYNYIDQMAKVRASNKGVNYLGNQADRNVQERHFGDNMNYNPQPQKPAPTHKIEKQSMKKEPVNSIEVGNQQQSGFI